MQNTAYLARSAATDYCLGGVDTDLVVRDHDNNSLSDFDQLTLEDGMNATGL